MSQLLKFYFASEIRRTRVPLEKVSLSLLIQKVHELFPQLETQAFSFSYIDEDKDKIYVDQNEELQEALRFSGESVLKLNIEMKKQNSQPHRGVFCDGCGVHNPEGCRFKCLNCEDFDFCEKCERNPEKRQQHGQSHIFLRMSHPVGLLSGAPYLKETLPNSSQTGPQEHPGVECDKCDKKIVGIRYKCAVCANYDLCDSCIEKSAFYHPTQHPFIKLETPIPFSLLSGFQLYEAHHRVLLPVPVLKGCPFRRNGCPRRRGGKKCHFARKEETPTPTESTPPPCQKEPETHQTTTVSITTTPSTTLINSSSESESESSVDETQPLLSNSNEKEHSIVQQKVFDKHQEILDQLSDDDSWTHEWEPLAEPLPQSQEELPPTLVSTEDSIEVNLIKSEVDVQTSQQESLPQTPQEEISPRPFQSQLDYLEGMGFTDIDRNLACLVRHRGNLEAAVNELLAL